MKHIYNILYGLLFIVSFPSCTADETILNSPDQGSGKTAQVMLSLSIPGQQLPSQETRSISNDKAIESLYVLEFVDGQWEKTEDITDKYKPDDNNNIYISLEETSKPIELVLIANSDKVSDIEHLGFTDRKGVLRSLIFDINASLNTIPMYGSSSLPDGISRNDKKNIKVELERSLSCIEVICNSTQSKDEFELLGIEVLNINQEGCVVTNMLPTISAGTESTGEITSNGTTASAYVAETLNTNHAISVLVHARYKGTECYYKLDMLKNSQDKDVYVETLMRNYKYSFSLQSIPYLGKGSRAEAINNPADNKSLGVRVMTISAAEEDIRDITTNDYYFLGVNSSNLRLEKLNTNTSDQTYFVKLKVLTNNTDEGWNISGYPSGVSFSEISGGKAISDAKRKVTSVWIYVDKNIIKSDFTFYVTSSSIRKAINIYIN